MIAVDTNLLVYSHRLDGPLFVCTMECANCGARIVISLLSHN
jgi:hypothetical protein